MDFLQYPLSISRSELDADDLRRYSKELDLRSTSLFVPSSDGCNVEFWEAGDASGLQITQPPRKTWQYVGTLSALHDLQNTWKAAVDQGKTSILIINRKNSWSRLKILPDMFKFICSSIDITPKFLDHVFGLGRKSSSVDETFISLHRSLSFTIENDPQLLSYDICYNLRYFEPHGRQLCDPWALRQTAVHQKFFFNKGFSNWTIIQPPASFRGSLEDIQSFTKLHPLSLHIRYIRSACFYWRDHLTSRHSELLSLDGEISISKPLSQYGIDFSVIQRIQAIRKKLHLASAVLNGLLDIVSNLTTHTEELGSLLKLSQLTASSIKNEFAHIHNELKSHRSSVKTLLDISGDICSTSQNILAFSNQEVAVRNGTTLTHLAHLGATENQELKRLTDKTRRDSRIMRIATIVAMVYLPANLVLSFFSTELVEFYSTDLSSIPNSGIAMRVHSQIWIAGVASFLLAIVTMALVVLWDRYFER